MEDNINSAIATDAAQSKVHAGERLLRSLADRGVSYIFGNLGTDHTPLLEAIARIEAEGNLDEIPELVSCPHEFVAMSAAHGYAVTTGEPQAVLVHVDVGTQNLGAAMHNAHRANAPVFIISGLAPITDSGHPGSRDHPVHYIQDVYDQPAVVEEYCRWVMEYQPPADPDQFVARGLKLAQSVPEGPVYLSAGREALETTIELSPSRTKLTGSGARTGADQATVTELAEMVNNADAPLVITSRIGSPASSRGLDALVEFAEKAGAGVIEHSPSHLCFPRNHDLHVGHSPTDRFDETDLVIAVDADVPWVPNRGDPDAPVIQIDADAAKPTYPQWDFPVTRSVSADATATLEDVSEQLDANQGAAGRKLWGEISADRRKQQRETLSEHREAERLTPIVLSDAIDDIVDDSTIIVEDTVTSRGSVLSQVNLTKAGSYYHKAGSGLGWTGGAAIGAALGNPDNTVVSLVGDGSYFFSHPSASSWFSNAVDVSALTVIYDNSGWNAVKTSTLAQHPDGAAADSGVPGSVFDPTPDLTAPAEVVNAHTDTVTDLARLEEALESGLEAVENGTNAVIDVKLEPIE